MKPRHLITTAFAVLVAYLAGFIHGAWTERDDWRNAREMVVRDLVRKGLNPSYLGPTEIIDVDGQPVTYGFTYAGPTGKYDYVVYLGGLHGGELSIWDYSRTD